MTLTQKQKKIIAIAGAAILLAIAVYAARDAWMPIPDNTTYRDRTFSFEYPRSNMAQEYAPGVVSIGGGATGAFSPIVEVVTYKNDPDVPRPATFDAFVQRQAQALCGTDSPGESLACAKVATSSYTSSQGLSGQKLELALIRKNLKSGTTTDSSFGPIYVFNTTEPAATSTAGRALRYQAVFVYPSLEPFMAGEESADLIDQIVESLVLPDGVSAVTR